MAAQNGNSSSTGGAANGKDEDDAPIFKITKWTAIATWAYDIIVDTCAICRNHIMERCIECHEPGSASTSTEECAMAIGTCKHAFHRHCIERWLKTRQVCPLCNTAWKYA